MATGLENLWIYRLAEDLEIEVYNITKKFPIDEIDRAIDQLRRSSASVANNVAESYHKTTEKEKCRFLGIAKGEAEETKRGILRAARKNFLSELDSTSLANKYTIFLKGTNSYINFLKQKESGILRQRVTTNDQKPETSTFNQ